MPLKEQGEKLKTDIPAVFLAMKQKETPLSAKIFAGIAIAYALSPIDLIPDFIPVLGHLDDVIILPIFIGLAVKQIPPEVFAQCREQAVNLWVEGRPKRWYFVIPILLIWLLVIILLIKTILF